MYLLQIFLFEALLLMIEGGFITSPMGPKPIWNTSYTDRLRQDLLLNYDKYARPAQHYNTTIVKFGLTARHFYINEMKSTFTLHCYVKLVWTDEKLKWNSSDYGNLSMVHLADHEVWQPDIFVYNSATSQAVNAYGSTPVILYENGKVIWVPPGQFTVLCEIDLKYWPFDTQECRIIIASWTHDGEQIDLELFNSETEIADDHLIESHEWKLISSTVEREEKRYPCCVEFYPFIYFNVTLQRISPSYKAVVVSPAFVVIFLILMAFWLPPHASEKIILQGCTAVIIVMYLIYFTQKLPAMGTNTPLIVLFYSHALYIVCFSMIGSTVVIWLARTPHYTNLPWTLKQCLIGTFGNSLWLSEYIAQTNINRRVNTEELQNHEGNGDINDRDQHIMDENHHIVESNRQVCQQDWILLAVAIDRISFYFYLVLFFILSFSYSL